MEFWLWPSSEESYSCQVGQYDLVDWGFGQSEWPFSPLGAKYRRMQFICLREELGWDEYEPMPARPLRFAEFYLVDPPRQRLAALTIRLKQIPNGRNAYYQPTWDNTGWTTVLQAKNVPLNVGTAFELDYATMVNLVRFDFTQEFMYDPAYNLAVDISISASGTDYGGLCMLWMADQTRAIIGEETSGSSQPTDWSGSQGNAEVTQSVPLMWLGSGDEVRFFVDWILARKFSGIRRESLEVSYPANSPYAIAVVPAPTLPSVPTIASMAPSWTSWRRAMAARKALRRPTSWGSRGRSPATTRLHLAAHPPRRRWHRP